MAYIPAAKTGDEKPEVSAAFGNIPTSHTFLQLIGAKAIVSVSDKKP
jgi:hypothetical protein